MSTSLLAGLIACCMRATGQTHALTGALAEPERRLVAARAILGEWLAGSGGGWQDSGGVWPGIKLITGQLAGPDDPEYGISRGRLLPGHRILGRTRLARRHGAPGQPRPGPRRHGAERWSHPGAVTEKYLLRPEAEWLGRQEACEVVR